MLNKINNTEIYKDTKKGTKDTRELLIKRNQLSLRKIQNFKKSIGFLKMDIFKNVQNEKPEIFFENSKLFLPL